VAFYDQLLARIRALPTVTTVGAAQGIPFSGWDVQGDVNAYGRPAPRPNEEVVSHFQVVYPDFFRAMSIPLVRGRMLDETDRHSRSLRARSVGARGASGTRSPDSALRHQDDGRRRQQFSLAAAVTRPGARRLRHAGAGARGRRYLRRYLVHRRATHAGAGRP